MRGSSLLSWVFRNYGVELMGIVVVEFLYREVRVYVFCVVIELVLGVIWEVSFWGLLECDRVVLRGGRVGGVFKW